MASSTYEKEIAKYVHQLDPKQQKIVLNVVKTIAATRKDWWNELNEEQLSAIKEAEDELDAGKGIPHSQVMKKLSKDVKSYGNDPYFQKKAKESKAFLEKHGFPEELIIKK